MSSTIASPEVEVAIIGAGPAGLAAALALGRACRSVVVFDAGSPRNAAATHIHNFVTRDGTPPAEFREIAREQLREYPSVRIRDACVTSVVGRCDAFVVRTSTGVSKARRLVLCTGMVDDQLDIPGFREAWGHSIFQCPYCHGWEVRGRRWGYLALDATGLQHGFPAMLRGWTDDVVVFADSGIDIGTDQLDDLARRGIRVERRAIKRLLVEGNALTHAELADGERVECGVLFAHPPQRQVDIIGALGVALDEQGYVRADPMTRTTSVAGIYAAGDLTTRAQGAIFAAATGTQAGAMCNHDLTLANVW